MYENTLKLTVLCVFMELQINGQLYLWLISNPNPCFLLPTSSPVFSFLCSVKVTGRRFSIPTLFLNPEPPCNSPHIIPSFLELRGDH